MLQNTSGGCPSIHANGLDTTAASGAAFIAATHEESPANRLFAWDIATGRRVELAAPGSSMLGLVWTGKELIAMGQRDNTGPMIGLRLGP